MKPLLLNLTKVLAISLILFTSCKKYPEGPVISLETRKARVANNWKVEKALEDGVDKTSDYDGVTLLFDKKGNASITVTSQVLGGAGLTMQGKWEFFDSDKKLRLIMDSGNNSSDITEFTILKLKEKSMWLKLEDSGTITELHLIPK